MLMFGNKTLYFVTKALDSRIDQSTNYDLFTVTSVYRGKKIHIHPPPPILICTNDCMEQSRTWEAM
jgi:hypothetical protein